MYRHYKGPTYLVLGVAHDTNAADLIHADEVDAWLDGPGRRGHEKVLKPMGERNVVVYVGLERSGKDGPPMAVRTDVDFNELLCTNEACVRYGKHTGIYHANFVVECQGCTQMLRPRFVYIGET